MPLQLFAAKVNLQFNYSNPKRRAPKLFLRSQSRKWITVKPHGQHFHENVFFFFMFWDVPECSGMFRNVPCSGFYRRPSKPYGLYIINKWSRRVRGPLPQDQEYLYMSRGLSYRQSFDFFRRVSSKRRSARPQITTKYSRDLQLEAEE